MTEKHTKTLAVSLLEENLTRSIETQTLIQLLIYKGIFTVEEYKEMRHKVCQLPDIKELIRLIDETRNNLGSPESIKKGCEGKHDN